jgi:hypothetical protein
MSTMTHARRDAIEYRTVRGSPWVAMRFRALSTDFVVTEAEMPAFHEAAKGCGRLWVAVRLIFGLHPMLPALSSDPNLLGVFSIRETAALLKVTPAELTESLGSVTVRWFRAKDRQ